MTVNFTLSSQPSIKVSRANLDLSSETIELITAWSPSSRVSSNLQ